MCFVLYAGTSHPIPQRAWRNDAPDVSVRPLSERESPIVRQFSKPQVQYIGSTSRCGCDFPHVTFQNGGWPWFEDDEIDVKQQESDRYNRQALVELLRGTGEPTVELYGVWDGDFSTAPGIREQIQLDR